MKLSRITLYFAFSLLIMAGFAGSVVTAAASDSSSVQGYAADSVLQTGTVVQLTSNNRVTAASRKNANQMYGVTVDPHELSLTVSNTNLKNEAYVATSGAYNVLVSTQAGAIRSGDYITLSAIDGVAMDAGTSDSTVFGRALGSFDGQTNSLGKTTLKDASGKTAQTVDLGLVPVAIAVQHNPSEKSTKANLPSVLQRAGEAVADKPVSPLRIILSVAIIALSIIVAAVALYAGIRSSLTAIGRNPLSKKAILRGLIEVVITGVLILIIGLFAVYLLLKL